MNLTLTVDSYLKEQVSLVESHLEYLIPYSSSLFDAARYSLLAPGKRLRPILAIATYQLFECDDDMILSPACALEMVHTYSLIHDDLPSMDNDDFRRGRPTLHRKFTEGIAILTGDYLLTYAFEVIAKGQGLSSEQKVSLITCLSEAAGSFGMVGGQIADLQATGKSITLETLQSIHSQKTGALISAAVQFGGIVANAPPKTLSILKDFAYHIGLAFQIIDDVLDITQCKEKHGKEVASDQLNKKTTYATILGVEKAEQYAKQHVAQSQEVLRQLPHDTSLLQSLASWIVYRNK